MQLRRWATISVLHRTAPACSCVQTMRTRVSMAHAGCMRTSEAAPCMHSRNICKYTYTCTSGTWSILRICMSTTAYARMHIYRFYVRIQNIVNIYSNLCKYVYNHARVNVHGIRGIVVRARTLTAFTRTHTCIDNLLSYVETNYATTWTILRSIT